VRRSNVVAEGRLGDLAAVVELDEGRVKPSCENQTTSSPEN
jgi:hypothetical protein